jgi:hypothetical protein
VIISDSSAFDDKIGDQKTAYQVIYLGFGLCAPVLGPSGGVTGIVWKTRLFRAGWYEG